MARYTTALWELTMDRLMWTLKARNMLEHALARSGPCANGV
jgi:hypothetical protein